MPWFKSAISLVTGARSEDTGSDGVSSEETDSGGAGDNGIAVVKRVGDGGVISLDDGVKTGEEII